jgi:hypothetical protein
MTFSSLWTTIKEFFDKDRKQMDFYPIDLGHILKEDPPLKPRSIEAGSTYVRLRLAQMFLRKEVQWLKSWQPAVHSLVRLEAGDQALEVPNIADATRIGIQPTDAGLVISKKFVLTPTLPFNGGLVHLSAGLMAIEGQNYLKNALQVLGGFAELLNVTQFSAALNVVQPLALGIQNVFTGEGKTHMHLGIHNTYAAGELQAGYIVAVRATEQQLKPDELWVVGGQLRRGRGPDAGQSVPLEGFDYLLLRVEVFEQRDDWEKLSAIEEPFREALKALHDPATEDQAPQYLRTAFLKTRLAPELTRADRRRVVQNLKDQYEEVKKDLGTAKLRGRQVPSLEQVMKGGMSVTAALKEGEPTVEEIFAIARK